MKSGETSDSDPRSSNIAAQGDVAIRVAGDLTIQSGQDTVGNANTYNNKAIGTVVISDTERFAGYHTEDHRDDSAQVTQVASSVGSLGGSVSLTAGGAYTQSASNVVAAKDVDITAASIDVLTANDTHSASSQDDTLKFGVFARVKSPLIDLINNVDAARNSDGRLSAMQGMAAAANGYQAASAISSTAGGAGSGSLVSVEAGVGYATSTEQYKGSSQTSQGSTISGGGNVSLNTTQGDLHVVQGNLKAGDTLSLDSARDLVLEAGNSSSSEHSKGSNAGVEVGVGVSVGAQTGYYAYVQASVGSHSSNVDGAAWKNTELAGQTISLTSQGDTTLRGAVAKADRIDVQTGGDLTIESLQDTVDSQSKESGYGGRIQVSFGTAWDASGYASAAKASGNYAGVVEQSGLFAGEGGYHVTAGNVNLIGGAIASTNADNSELTADSLTYTDLKNQMGYSAASGSISGGFGSTGNGQSSTGADGSTVGGQAKDIGNTIANGNYGQANTANFSGGVPMSESGKDTSTTRATLTEGKIVIGGKRTTAAETGINTDASVANEVLATLPDVRKLMVDQQAMGAAAGTVIQTGQQIAGDIAANAKTKADNAREAYRRGLDEDGLAAFDALSAEKQQNQLLDNSADYKAAYDSQRQWGTGGDYSRALQAVTTALVGSVSGQAASQVAGNALAPYAAQLIGQTFDGNHGSDPNAAAQVLSHALLGAVLAEVNGTSGTGGALAGASGELAAQWLTKELYGNDPRAIDPESGKFNPNLLPEEDKQTLVALSQAVGALVGSMTGGTLNEASVGSTVAKNAVENNWLSQSEVDAANEAIKACDAKGADAKGCRKQIVDAMNELDQKRDRELLEDQRIILSKYQKKLIDAKGACGDDLNCYARASTSLKSEAKEELQSLDSTKALAEANRNGKVLAGVGYYPDGVTSEILEGVKGRAKVVPDEIKGAYDYVADRGVGGIASDIADGVKQSIKDFSDWLDSDIPSQAIERKIDNFATMSASEVGGVAFDGVLGTLVATVGGEAGGKIIQLVGGKWVPLAGKTLDDFVSRRVAQGGLVVDRSSIGMVWNGGIDAQGKPFEGFIQSILPSGTIDLNTIKSNFAAFDHLTPDGIAVSDKTLNTLAPSYSANPDSITSLLNRYVNKMDAFTSDGKGTTIITSNMISGKQMQLAIPYETNAAQMKAISKSVEYAKSRGVEIIIVRIK